MVEIGVGLGILVALVLLAEAVGHAEAAQLLARVTAFLLFSALSAAAVVTLAG